MPWDEVMSKWKKGKLHSGSKHGRKVKNQKQAVAIMLSEKRAAKKKHELSVEEASRGPKEKVTKPKPSVTETPESDVTLYAPTLTKEKRKGIGIELQRFLEQAQGERSVLDEALVVWNNMYEMRLPQKSWPWEGCSNIFVPLIPDRTDTLVSRIAQEAFQPRMYLVRGLTPEAQKAQSLVERYYNAELWRHNWVEPHYQLLHLGARDGTSIMEVVWNKRIRVMNLSVDAPVIDEKTGLQALDEQGNPKTEKKTERNEYTDYDDVELTPVELRDFIMFPAYSRSIEEAALVGRAHYFSPNELQERQRTGQFFKEAVEYVTKTGPTDELAADRQETSTYTAGGKISVGDDATDQPELGEEYSIFKVWRLNGSLFDLDGDGVNEENVFWVHQETGTLLGVEPYEYQHGRRPWVPLAIMPRPGRFYGYAVPERLLPNQIQLNANRNHRNDQLDLLMSPPMYKTAGAHAVDEDTVWGPGAEYIVNDANDVGMLQLPPINPASYTEDQMIFSESDSLLGLNVPTPTAGGRNTKAQVQVATTLMGVRLGLMSKRMLYAMKEILWQIHELKKQYGPDVDKVPTQVQQQATTLEVPKNILLEDYELDVNGLANPMEAATRRQEKMFLYTLFKDNPLVQGHLDRLYYLSRDLAEDFDGIEVESVLGTVEQAMQQQQQQQQEAQQEKQLQALSLISGVHHAQTHGNATKPKQRPATGGMHPGQPPQPGA